MSDRAPYRQARHDTTLEELGTKHSTVELPPLLVGLARLCCVKRALVPSLQPRFEQQGKMEEAQKPLLVCVLRKQEAARRER